WSPSLEEADRIGFTLTLYPPPRLRASPGAPMTFLPACLLCLSSALAAADPGAVPGARVDVSADHGLEADVLLVGGTLFDGTGKPGVAGTLALKGDRIVAIGRADERVKLKQQPRVIDVTGLYVAPGFIDLHSHSDVSLPRSDARANLRFLKQGCTLVVT